MALGRAVLVPEHPAGRGMDKGPDGRRHPKLFAGGADLTQWRGSTSCFQGHLGQLCQKGRGQEDPFDGMLSADCEQPTRVQSILLRDQGEHASGTPCREALLDGDVKVEWRELKRGASGSQG